jgi:hypothetical protein
MFSVGMLGRYLHALNSHYMGVIKALLSEHVMGLPMLPPYEITLYQCKLLYTTTCTHFDIMFSIDILGRYSHTLNSHHMTMAKYVLGYLKYTLNAKLVYHSKKVTAYAYVNADFTNALGRKSVLRMALSINYC